MTIKAIAAAAVIGLSVGSAQASAVFDFQETGLGVVGTMSGFLDLTGATNLGLFSAESVSAMAPGAAIMVLQTPGSTQIGYKAVSPSSFGSGGTTYPSSVTGTGIALFLAVNEMYISEDYASGSAISGTMTYAGASFASLGVTLGDYVWTLPNDTLTLRFTQPDPAPVPLPASLPLLAVALGAFGWMRRKT